MLNLRRRALLPVALFLGAAIGPAAPLIQRAPELKPRPGGTLRIKAYLTPFNPTFDPAAPAHFFVIEQLYDGLVKFDNQFNIIPALAEYWTISDDGNTITFNLRKGVKFHNGRELTADDVKFSLERLVQNRPGNTTYQYFTPKVAGAEDFWQGRASEVSGFRVADRYVFEIRWTRPFGSTGLYLLGMYYCKVLPRDLVQNQGRGFFQKPVGTGPFKFAYWLRSPRLDVLGVRLERNYLYFGKKPYLDALEYSPNFTEDQFEQGDVHLISVVSERMSRKGYQILENNSLRSVFLVMSCDVPPLDRPEIRRALALGIDKARLADACYTAASVPQVLENYIPPILPGYFPRDLSPLYDPEKASLLLDRLLPADGASRMTLTLVLPPPRAPFYPALARELERQLGLLSIRLDVRHLREEEDARTIRRPFLKYLDYTMQFPDPENIIMPLYRSGSLTNLLNSRYANPKLDRLLEQSETEPSWEKRAAMFRAMEKILFGEVPAIPLFSERIRIALLPGVRGAKLPAMGFYCLDTKEIWLED